MAEEVDGAEVQVEELEEDANEILTSWKRTPKFSISFAIAVFGTGNWPSSSVSPIKYCTRQTNNATN